MISQNPFFQKNLADTKPVYDGVCCEPCYNAKGEKCVCRCGGRLHGVGSEKWNDQNNDMVLDGEDRQKFLDSLVETKCHWCGSDLSMERIHGYPHAAGWKLKNGKLYWLYIVCSKCGYQWALWKLGVNRE